MENTEIQRLKAQPVKRSLVSFSPRMKALVYDHDRASPRSEKMEPLWQGPVRLVRRRTEHIWKYEDQPHEGPGRKNIQVAHEDHLQSYDDKR